MTPPPVKSHLLKYKKNTTTHGETTGSTKLISYGSWGDDFHPSLIYGQNAGNFLLPPTPVAWLRNVEFQGRKGICDLQVCMVLDGWIVQIPHVVSWYMWQEVDLKLLYIIFCVCISGPTFFSTRGHESLQNDSQSLPSFLESSNGSSLFWRNMSSRKVRSRILRSFWVNYMELWRMFFIWGGSQDQEPFFCV